MAVAVDLIHFPSLLLALHCISVLTIATFYDLIYAEDRLDIAFLHFLVLKCPIIDKISFKDQFVWTMESPF